MDRKINLKTPCVRRHADIPNDYLHRCVKFIQTVLNPVIASGCNTKGSLLAPFRTTINIRTFIPSPLLYEYKHRVIMMGVEQCILISFSLPNVDTSAQRHKHTWGIILGTINTMSFKFFTVSTLFNVLS